MRRTHREKQIDDLTERYDFIMVHHSFEHMAEPKDVLGSLHRILQPTGQLILRIPLVDSHAWRNYGVHWVQLDAPRHFFLHTVRSVQLLCDKAGL
ncbi:methyltransferase domain-containing protein [Paraburkholderia tropica]|uniref:methyltransferase domain-containing protein n=1 Tax=Paraburkholderia tropica TaxID=92647 RepID=UPI002AB5ED29|nr:methyltransferase domain-containing protein [Paraburkholderia tropica]